MPLSSEQETYLLAGANRPVMIETCYKVRARRRNLRQEVENLEVRLDYSRSFEADVESGSDQGS